MKIDAAHASLCRTAANALCGLRTEAQFREEICGEPNEARRRQIYQQWRLKVELCDLANAIDAAQPNSGSA